MSSSSLPGPGSLVHLGRMPTVAGGFSLARSPDGRHASPVERRGGAAELLRAQWDLLRGWLEDERVLDHAGAPSGLGAWTVSDLVVHLGFALRMVAEVTPSEREPLTLVEYVGGYAPAHDQIAADTHEVADQHRGRELAGIDSLAAPAWAAIAAGLPDVVLGRRGPLRGEDFLLTRLLELVTHGDDLHRCLLQHTGADRPTPLLPAAVDLVAAALAEGYEQVAGARPAWTGLELVRLATGRTPSDDPHLPLLS